MDSALFDKRGYPIVAAKTGYAEWAGNYETTVAAGLDRPLLERLTTVDWKAVEQAVDLACGTGRTGAWLTEKGVGAIDGIDITPEMLAIAADKQIYRELKVADVSATPLPAAAYGLAILVLADEHLAELGPVYREAARLTVPGGCFVLIGYHPFLLMDGLPTHYHRASGEAVTIRSYVHLFSEHYAAGREAGFSLGEFQECVVDEAWLATKPKWRHYLNRPVSFALVWRRNARHARP